MEYIPGPDFPTAALISGKKGIEEAIVPTKKSMRAKADIEVDNNGKETIIVTEIPYQVNKARLIEKIAVLVKEKKIEGISALRDEPDKDGMRIVIEVKRNESGRHCSTTYMHRHSYRRCLALTWLPLITTNLKSSILKKHLKRLSYIDVR